ncbi:MAG: HAMP domain-containing histidine kinase [Clostridia bacterium]|nr:HAMP domain-containing histidine kinase [Clostridia bacterium]
MTLRKKTIFIIVLLAILTWAFCISYAMPDSPHKVTRILVMNSYNDRYQWSKEVLSGIYDTLDTRFPDTEIRVEHMDTKYLFNDDYLEQMYQLYYFKYSDMAFDAIISTDDNALKFLLRYREALFPDVPIFACGINSFAAHNMDDERDVYGIIEKGSPIETLKVALDLNPEIDKVYVVVDDGISGQSTRENIQEAVAHSNLGLEMICLDHMDFVEIEKAVSEIEDPNAIVLYAYFTVDENNTFYTVKDTTERLVAASPVPVYGLWSFTREYGVVGGKMVSGYGHGTNVVEMAADYFEGLLDDGTTYMTLTDTNQYMYDFEVLERFGLDVDKLPPESIISNQPLSFYEKHKRVLQVALLVGIFLVGNIVILKHRVAARTQILFEQEQRLMESKRLAALGNVVAGVAHEINTPLGNAIMISSYIQKENNTFVDHHQPQIKGIDALEHFFKLLDERLLMLIDNLKKSEKVIDAFKHVTVYNEGDQEVFSVKKYVDNLQLLMANVAPCEVAIDCAEDVYIKGDPNNLFQMFNQLIENSIVHGFDALEGGKVHIEIRRVGEKVIIRYTDDGKGIKKGLGEDLFNPFITDKRNKGHIGLGLYTVYNIVSSMSGTIYYDDRVDVGVLFVVELPAHVV